MDTDQTAPLGFFGSSLIMAHSVCFDEKFKSEVHLNTCSRHEKQTTFSRQKNSDGIRIKDTTAVCNST